MLEKRKAALENSLEEIRLLHVPDSRVEWWNPVVAVEEGKLVLEGDLGGRQAFRAVDSMMKEFWPEVVFEMKLLPENDSGMTVNGLVNNSVAFIRKEPSSKKELCTQALLGTPVRILKVAHEKRLIQTPDGYVGWVNLSEVWPLSRSDLAKHRKAQKIVFTAQQGYAYSDPDPASRVISDLVAGCILESDGREEGFFSVIYPDGRKAWVMEREAEDAMEFFSAEPSGKDVVNKALDYLGIPYLWGGSSSKAADCSGLVSSVFLMNGIIMPRDADQQSECGKELGTAFDTTGLLPGDLLFFGSSKVNHVAIYLGEGEYIHASGHRDRVGINSMDPDHENYIESYPDIFIRSCRMLGEEAGVVPLIRDNHFYADILFPENGE